MTHAWSIMIVLSVGAVMFYAGVFEAAGRPRFEGLHALGIQPIPDQVLMYSDGIIVLTVVNTKPYKHKLEFVEVAPIADRNDVIQTSINTYLTQGELGVFDVNGSNLLSGVIEASVLAPPGVSAKPGTVNFHICMKESYSVGGQPTSRTVCGKAWNIPAEEGTSPADCKVHQACACTIDSDCSLVCQRCIGGRCDNYIACGLLKVCTSTEFFPEGECVPYFPIT